MSKRLFPAVQPGAAAARPNPPPMCREVKWDFEQERPVFRAGEPVIVEGAEAVLTWALHALRTPRYRHEIFSWAYGCELENLIGRPYTGELKQAEGRRYVREALAVSPYINGVEDVTLEFADGRLSMECRIATIYGEVTAHV